jgi:CRISPR-associated endonuclease/helicase Cas3
MWYAHSDPGRPEHDWESLMDHLERVAEQAAVFASAFGAADWGRLAGLWHDIGKYSAEFQAYLRSETCSGACRNAGSRRVDHSTAGAQLADKRLGGVVGRLLAYCIAGHHGGLPDHADPAGGAAGLHDRLLKDVCDWSAAPCALLSHRRPAPPPHRWPSGGAGFALSVFCRMLYSCLVDADFLATESFVRASDAAQRTRPMPGPAQLLSLLDDHLHQLQAGAANTAVNHARASVLADCRAAASLPPGLFSLTAPTGGGKTLSSLAFSLGHAAHHGHRRVIYGIPFTSIIEQNTDVFRRALGPAGDTMVLEHHSNLEPQMETRASRMAAENWDAPLIVTTTVQLYESLFANRPSRCRKLHRVAKSVIILDECQTLPVTLLAPTLRMINELCANYGCTVVLCSATQPAIRHRPEFAIGLRDVREIVTDPDRLHAALERVDVRRLGLLTDGAVAQRLTDHDQVLCIVNTRRHAAELYQLVGAADRDNTFHLSASMCAAHRTSQLEHIRRRLSRRQTCRVISTQLVEAGVDIDFPVVYRAMTGLDSIAQAAGRCNREGHLGRGRVFVFDTAVDPPGELRQRRQAAAEVAAVHADLLGLPALDHYFRLSYWSRSGEWDASDVLACFSQPPHFQFRTAAERYKLIADNQRPVLVPYGIAGQRLVDELYNTTVPPGREYDRRAQRYLVGVYERDFQRLVDAGLVACCHERFWVLLDSSVYSEHVGLTMDAAGDDTGRLIV